MVITLMIPTRHDDGYLSTILVDQVNTPYYNRVVSGVEYACIHVSALPHKFIATYV